jgi:hypothetical protein
MIDSIGATDTLNEPPSLFANVILASPAALSKLKSDNVAPVTYVSTTGSVAILSSIDESFDALATSSVEILEVNEESAEVNDVLAAPKSAETPETAVPKEPSLTTLVDSSLLILVVNEVTSVPVDAISFTNAVDT